MYVAMTSEPSASIKDSRTQSPQGKLGLSITGDRGFGTAPSSLDK